MKESYDQPRETNGKDADTRDGILLPPEALTNLQQGGPKVDIDLLDAYNDGTLESDERHLVELLICTHRAWFLAQLKRGGDIPFPSPL